MHSNDSTIRVWFTGPTTVTDERGTRVDGTFADLPGDTRTRTTFHTTREAPDWEHSTIAKEQESDRAKFAWLHHGGAWKEGRVEAAIDTKIRGAVTVEREACAAALDALAETEDKSHRAATNDDWRAQAHAARKAYRGGAAIIRARGSR